MERGQMEVCPRLPSNISGKVGTVKVNKRTRDSEEASLERVKLDLFFDSLVNTIEKLANELESHDNDEDDDDDDSCYDMEGKNARVENELETFDENVDENDDEDDHEDHSKIKMFMVMALEFFEALEAAAVLEEEAEAAKVVKSKDAVDKRMMMMRRMRMKSTLWLGRSS